MDAPIKYLLRPFEGNIIHGYPTGIKVYIQAKKQIDKEPDKLDISVSNVKEIIDHFLGLAKNMSGYALHSQ